MKNQQLKEFMQAQGLGQKQVANAFGVSVATVSQYLSGKYQGNCEELDRKVDEMLERQKAKVVEAKYNSEFVPTLVAKRGMEVMRFYVVSISGYQPETTTDRQSCARWWHNP